MTSAVVPPILSLDKWSFQSEEVEKKGPQWDKGRLAIGLVLVAIAVLMVLFLEGDGSTAGVAAIGVLGLISIATSRRR